MSLEQVAAYIGALDARERLITSLALFTGMRPGEILGLQRQHVGEAGKTVIIAQRIYRGDVDTPKTKSSARIVAVPPATAALLLGWTTTVDDQQEAWLFPSENRVNPIWRDNLWNRDMKPKLDPLGLGWATFQVLRRTHASLGHDAGIDPKVAADQRGHGIGVALDVYTKTGLQKRADAAEKLERLVFSRPGKRSDAA